MTLLARTGRCAIIATVNARPEVLRPWAWYHLNSGFDQLFLFFDDPHDTALEELDGLEGVTSIACSRDWWREQCGARPEMVEDRQVANVNAGLQQARDAACQWAAHLDSDELIQVCSPLKPLLQGSTADALQLSMCEAVSERFDYERIFDSSLFKRQGSRLQLALAAAAGCRHALRYGEYFLGHRQSKMLVRVDGAVRRMGVHRPLDAAENVRIEHTEGLRLLHFDGVGFSDWDRKWQARLQGDHRFRGMRPARRKQMEAYRRADRSGLSARQQLFRDVCMLPGREIRVLKRLHLMETIDIDPSHFSPPADAVIVPDGP